MQRKIPGKTRQGRLMDENRVLREEVARLTDRLARIKELFSTVFGWPELTCENCWSWKGKCVQGECWISTALKILDGDA